MVREYSPQTRPNQGQNYPPLQSGDSPLETLRERLTRPEFERRYAASPHIKKAELIEGIVYVASPVQLLKLTASPDRTVLYSLVLCPLRLLKQLQRSLKQNENLSCRERKMKLFFGMANFVARTF